MRIRGTCGHCNGMAVAIIFFKPKQESEAVETKLCSRHIKIFRENMRLIPRLAYDPGKEKYPSYYWELVGIRE